MKLKFFPILYFVITFININAQNSKLDLSKNKQKKYPSNFSITKNEFDVLFLYKENDKIRIKTNLFIDKSTLLKNSHNGDMNFLKIKLNYFKNAFLLIQVNGKFSTQIFILSDDKSIFYKGKIETDKVTMTECLEDEIISQ